MNVALFFGGAAVVLGLAYLVFRVWLPRDYQRNGKLTVLSAIMETSIFALHGILVNLFLPADWPALHAEPVVLVFGAILLGFGLAAMFSAMAGLGWRRSVGREANTLRQGGFYRYSRNPQIMAYGLVVAGFALLWPSWYSLGWLALYPLIAHWMVTTEEEHLRRVYGKDYKKYCARVPRYIGKI